MTETNEKFTDLNDINHHKMPIELPAPPSLLSSLTLSQSSPLSSLSPSSSSSPPPPPPPSSSSSPSSTANNTTSMSTTLPLESQLSSSPPTLPPPLPPQSQPPPLPTTALTPSSLIKSPFRNCYSCSNLMKTTTSGGQTKVPLKTSRQGPSQLRQLMPVAACLLTFTTILSILIVYMDTTAFRHQQFRLNMSRDYEMYGVRQDDPTLIKFIQQIHMRKYPMLPYMKSFSHVEELDFHKKDNGKVAATAPTYADIMVELLAANGMSSGGGGGGSGSGSGGGGGGGGGVIGGVNNRNKSGGSGGVFIQSMPGSMNINLLTAPYLEEKYNWTGLIIEPEPKRYFSLRKESVKSNRSLTGYQIVHACVSPTGYPKEITLHHEEESVRINSLLNEEDTWFNSRVKCFSLYTLMLAVNQTNVDVLSLGCQNQTLAILETVPFEQVKIQLISIHLADMFFDWYLDVDVYAQKIAQFLKRKSYKLVKKIDYNFIYLLKTRK